MGEDTYSWQHFLRIFQLVLVLLLRLLLLIIPVSEAANINPVLNSYTIAIAILRSSGRVLKLCFTEFSEFLWAQGTQRPTPLKPFTPNSETPKPETLNLDVRVHSLAFGPVSPDFFGRGRA